MDTATMLSLQVTEDTQTAHGGNKLATAANHVAALTGHAAWMIRLLPNTALKLSPGVGSSESVILAEHPP